ncbi:glycosyltransferase [Streptomyces sp. FH025]|uniref:glycosyltransferase n=1 Tax=Streptomyces sp. FH025 TaxID=2815937 RepID=UPI001A9DDE22|nr:glycosyltransferase family 2 protein [Streptomyces sp. FH025]MBO1414918.1 glycosyltransferase family 2 protein [Streptomyces sp. FH025]
MTLLDVSISLSFVLGVSFLAYVAVIVRNFLRARPDAPGDPTGFSWHFFIPCRDEEAVIGTTLDYLARHFPDARLWVIDDHSEDRTAEVVRARIDAGRPVHLVSRRLPQARTGKGDALNAAYRALQAWLPEDIDADRVVVTVLDADGRPSPGMLDTFAGESFFGDPAIGAVQVEVRMSNRDVAVPLPGRGRLANRFARLLARMQDIEFRGPISAIQITRRYTGTVNVGGNGQANRLSALRSIEQGDGEPWGKALLEDFELGLRMMLAGWRNGYTTTAWVDQEALWNVRQLITQRVRWAQGAMQCAPYLRRIWGSRQFTTMGFLEVLYFMVQPWLQVIGLVVYTVPIAAFAYNLAVYPEFVLSFLRQGGAPLLALYLLVGVAEFAVWGPVYRRRSEPGTSRRAALGYGLALAVYAATTYIVAVRAFWRIVRRKGSWHKTARTAEPLPAAQEIVAA